MFLDLNIRGTKRLSQYIYEHETVKKRKIETEKKPIICEKKKKNLQHFYCKENKDVNYVQMIGRFNFDRSCRFKYGIP